MRRVLILVGWSVMTGALVVSVLGSGGSVERTEAQTLVCNRFGTCVPEGSTAVPQTPDGTRPPTFTPTVVSTATTVRPTNTAVATVATVCTRSTCVPYGSQ
mgnify:FL=1